MTAVVHLVRARISCFSVLTLALAGCASGGDFPSLARRPAERITGSATPDAAPSQPVPSQPAATAPSADITARLGQLQDAARIAHARFTTRRAAVERAAAGAGPLGSESWANASVALAELEEAHDQQTAALTAIDDLQVERQVNDAGADSPDLIAIRTARNAVAGAADADGEVVTRLRGRLGK